MNVQVKEGKREEIIIDNIPIGYIVLDEDNKIEHLEIYDSFLMSQYEFGLLLKFTDKVMNYDWVD